MANPVKAAVKSAFYHAGGLRAIRWMKRQGVRILMYHRFFDGPALARQCAHIRRYYNPVSMTAVAEWLHSGRSLEPYSVAVTVDDGYRDFLEVAYPIFRSYGIPVTTFLVSEFLDTRCWLWFDQVLYAFQHTLVPRAKFVAPGGEALTFELETHSGRIDAGRRLATHATNWGDEERLRLVRDLPGLLEVAIPAGVPPEYRALTWEEVRSLAANGMEFGAHTKTHPILSALSSPEQLRDEIDGSKARIEAELGRPVQHFCYPNGRAADIGPEAVQAVRRAGFRTAVTAVPGLNHPGEDPLLLRRIGADPEHENMYFQRSVAAFRI